MLSDVFNRFCRFTQGINTLVNWLVIGLLAILVCIVTSAVFYRYVLDDSLVWSSEAARYLCIWIGFLAASVALRRRMHIGLSVFTDRMGKQSRKAIRLISNLAIIVFLVFIAVLGFELSSRQMMQTSPALMMPMGIPYLAIPVSAVLMIFQMLSLLIIDLAGIPENQEEADPC